MRFLLGAAAALVLVGNALAAPHLSPTDLSPTDPDPVGGELPVKATRRPATRLVPHRLEGKTAHPAKPSSVAKSGAALKKPVAKKPAAAKKPATATKPVPAKAPVAGKGSPSKHAPVPFSAKPKALAAKRPATGTTGVKPHPVARATAPRKVVAGPKPSVAKHAATPGAKPHPLKSHPVKPLAVPVVKKVAPKTAPKNAVAKRLVPGKIVTGKIVAGKIVAGKSVAAKSVPGKTSPKGAVAVRMGAPKAERGAVQAKYDAMSHLIMRRDGARLAALFMGMTTPDFVYRDKKGKALNRTQLVGQLKAQMKMVKAFKQSSNKVVGFGLKGAGGVAQIVSQFAMVFPNGKKSVSVAGQSVTADTWVKTPKGWKLRAIRTLRESVKYNGKAV